MTSNVD